MAAGDSGSASGPARSSLSPSSGRPLPSTRLVSFDGFIGTMSQSDSRPQLDADSGRPLSRAPVGDHADGPGRASQVPTTDLPYVM